MNNETKLFGGVQRRYIPKMLSARDKKTLRKELKRSRSSYGKSKYYTRKKVASFKTKPSKHVVNAKSIYTVDNVLPSKELADKTGCSIDALERIMKKGQGAYFSSGSRPNQTGHSWGVARLASGITGGKAAAVDYSILENGCKPKSTALRLAKKSRKKNGYVNRRVPQVKL